MDSTRTGLPDFDQASAALAIAAIDTGIAEIHGLICGVLVSPGANDVDWLATVLEGDSDRINALPRPVSGLLLSLFQASRKVLAEAEFGISLLLPDAGRHDVVERTGAIAEWCRGFLLGLAEGGLVDFSALSNEAREALEDLIDIAEVVADEEGGEQQEQALAEVEEYVRVAVQFLYDEIQHSASIH